MKNIVLIGMPGSGKSTLGMMISEKLNMVFLDMDTYIEKMENKSIIDMFKVSEEYFRDAESKSAKQLALKSSLVIAAGGGIVKRKENIENLRQNSIIVFLNRPYENIINDIDIGSRPLLKEGKNELKKLYNERIHLYKKYCTIEVLNNKTLDDAVNEIISKVRPLIVS